VAERLLIDARASGARDAAAKRDEALRKASLGIINDPRLTVGDLFERWLTEVAALKLCPSSLERYRGIVRGQLVPALGRVALQSLTQQHVARAYAELAAPREVTVSHARGRQTVMRARSAASLRYAHAILHGALEQAVTWRMIERNPAAGAALPRRNQPEMRPLTPAEARQFLAAARGHPLEALFVLALTTGMRQGELLGLRWRDIDWIARRVSVHHTLVRLHGRWWLGEPKTAKSARSVDLTDSTLDLLRGHRIGQAERMLAHGHRLTDDDLIFCDIAGEPLWGRHVTTLQLKALLRGAGLPAIRFHDLRHTFATLQLTAGTNPKIVSEVLGHKEVAITLDRYSHALPTLGAEAMGRLDAVLGRSPLDAPDEGPPEAPSAELWVDEEPAAWSLTGSDGDKGPDKGPNAARRTRKRPDPNSDRAESGEVGTAYRIRTDDLRLERAVSWASRRMRRSQRGQIRSPRPVGMIAVAPRGHQTAPGGGRRCPAVNDSGLSTARLTA
jgi:integrase